MSSEEKKPQGPIIKLDEWILAKGRTDPHALKVLNHFHTVSCANLTKDESCGTITSEGATPNGN